MTPPQIRRKLRNIGQRRKRLRGEEEKLHRDTIKGLELALGVIPTTEAAELVGLNRSTVYEVYRGGRKQRQEAAASA